MKFGQNLPRNQVPEWAFAYIDYKRLKKIIKAVQQAVVEGEEPDLAGTHGVDALERHGKLTPSQASPSRLTASLKMLIPFTIENMRSSRAGCVCCTRSMAWPPSYTMVWTRTRWKT